ncbi:MAG: choice-of-anchor J domain-containing protein, partial [Bacteroidales bacterium]|nr:choice-of-anchor J domain-containing protein [Bacteroidales bacterium]
VTIFNQDWEGEMNGWTFVTVEGNKPWTVSQYQGNHYAYANGYNGGVNEQWCISPGFNMQDYGEVYLTFRNAKNYTGPDLELKYSTNYDGVDPTTATWWTFDFNKSPGSYTWVESGEIPISITPYPAHDCYIAFKYTSTETEAAAWEVDDIMLVGTSYVPNLTVTPSSLSGFTHVVGEGPSASQHFTLSGVNIGPAPGGSTGSIIIQSSENEFEVSLDNETFSWQVDIDGINGTLEPTPIYVRMNGPAVGQYTGAIEIYASSSDEATVSLSGTVTPQPVPGDDYVRITDMSQLVDGNRIVFAARFDENAADYYAMSNSTSSHPTGVLFTSVLNGSEEILPSSILNEEDNFYWTVNVTADGYTFTNANGELIGYSSSTNFSPNGDNTVWSIEIGTSEETAMVPNYTGFVIGNVNNPNRAFALNGSHNFGAYHIQNMASETYNFFLDIFMQGEGGSCTVAAPTFSPAGGTYYEAQNVNINCSTPGANIYYSTISENGPWIPYSSPITVDENMTIWAYAELEGCNDSPVVSAEYVIQAGLTIIFNQDWEEDWHGWTEVCVEGDSLWRIASYQGNHYAYANGYNHPATEDWLISPAFDLDSYDDVVLSFRTAMNYTGDSLHVYFSNDYDGQDPTAATWEELGCELSQGGWNWVETSVSLDEFGGSNCYIGFRYTCTDEEAAGWEVDDIMLVSGGISTDPYLIATPNALSGFSHVVGHGPSASQTFNLTGGNFLPAAGGSYGYVLLTLGDNSPFEISLDDEEYTSTLYIEIGGSTLDTTIFVRLWGDEIGQYDRVLLIEAAYQGIFNFLVTLSGEVLSADQPTISAAMPLYIQGNNGSNNNRVPVAIQVTLLNLEPNTTYRYTNQLVDDNDGPETAGAGNVIYVNDEGFYRSTSPSLESEGDYGEFTTSANGSQIVWFMNEPTANARFTPGNHVYLRIRLNDGHNGTEVANTFTTDEYATVLNFGTENDEYSGSAFYVKSEEAPMSFAMLLSDPNDLRPLYSTSIETTGVDYGNINQYADFYKEEVAGNDGWFGGILPNVNPNGINRILIWDLYSYSLNEYLTENGEWYPNANTVNPTNGLDEPIFIDLTYDVVEETVESNVKVWSADHEFVIENSDNAHYNMTVYNILGQPMIMKQINAGSAERISHSLATGVYIISLQNNQNAVSVKVIVK